MRHAAGTTRHCQVPITATRGAVGEGDPTRFPPDARVHRHV